MKAANVELVIETLRLYADELEREALTLRNIRYDSDVSKDISSYTVRLAICEPLKIPKELAKARVLTNKQMTLTWTE